MNNLTQAFYMSICRCYFLQLSILAYIESERQSHAERETFVLFLVSSKNKTRFFTKKFHYTKKLSLWLLVLYLNLCVTVTGVLFISQSSYVRIVLKPYHITWLHVDTFLE